MGRRGRPPCCQVAFQAGRPRGTWSVFPASTLSENCFVHTPFADSPEFQRLVKGSDNVQLARIALEIARDAYPDLDVEAYLKRIEELAARARSRFRPGAKVRDIIGQINWVLYVEEGIGGNWEEYYDPRNSYLNEVLDRKLGIPISLSVVYWTVAEHLGLPMAG